MRQMKGDVIFKSTIYTILAFILIIVAYPLWVVIISSISDPHQVALSKVWILPKGIQFEGYSYIFQYDELWIGYRNTIFYTALGTSLNLAATIPCAYALSKRYLRGRNIIMFIILITMYFGGGMIPTFLTVQKLGLGGTFWPVVLLGLVSPYNVIITRTFFATNIPEELEQAAFIDGCSPARTFFQIVIPLSKPIIAVIGLFCAVGHWNSYFSALVYLSKKNQFPLQMFLRDILVVQQNAALMEAVEIEQIVDLIRRKEIAEIMKYGVIIVSTLPLLIVYPFIQKYFVQGIMIGSLKG